MLRIQTPQVGLNTMSSIVINVRFNSVSSFPVSIGKDWTVLHLKTAIADKQNVSSSGLRIIFAGRALDDDKKLDDIDIGSNSVLHALEIRPDACAAVCSSSEQVSTAVSSACSGGDMMCKRRQYYVYCKTCQSIQPGKLRVQCDMCGDRAFLVDRGPNSWEDVLRAGMLTGTCQFPSCPGTFPRFYFRCGQHESSSENETAIPLHHIRPNSRRVDCITCGEKSSLVLVFPCVPGHVMCLDCFKNYGVTRLNNRMFVSEDDVGYTLPCPAGCEDSFIQEIHHFHLLGSDQYERYHRFATEECILREGGVLCPRPGCGHGLMPEDDGRKVCCPPPTIGCGLVFCKLCHEEYHDGQCGMIPIQPSIQDDIAVDEAQALRSEWEAASRDTIENTTKPCPRCHVKTEHSGGCMHMCCSQCRFQWCWLCAKSWNYDCQGNHWFG